jgi:hypothetical protein
VTAPPVILKILSALAESLRTPSAALPEAAAAAAAGGGDGSSFNGAVVNAAAAANAVAGRSSRLVVIGLKGMGVPVKKGDCCWDDIVVVGWYVCIVIVKLVG